MKLLRALLVLLSIATLAACEDDDYSNDGKTTDLAANTDAAKG